jgi:PhzF family phenazine biosynthesis protein
VIEALKPDLRRITEICTGLETAGITVFCENPAGSPARIRLRTFAPVVGVSEDPVCGSGNDSVAAWLAKHRHAGQGAFAYASEQGVEIGRHGRVQVAGTRSGDTWSIEVGGAAVGVVSGTLTLP